MARSYRQQLVVVALTALCMASIASAQNRVRFPQAQPYPTPGYPTAPFPNAPVSSPTFNTPVVPQTAPLPTQGGATPWVPVNPTAPASPAPTGGGVVLGAPQPFDPYSIPQQPAVPGVLPNPGVTAPGVLPPASNPSFSTPPLTSPPIPTAPPRQLPGNTVVPQGVSPWVPVQPGGLPPTTPLPTTPLPTTTLPSPTYPTAPFPTAPFPTAPLPTTPLPSPLPSTSPGFPPPPLNGSVLSVPSVVPLFPDGLPWQRQDGPYQRLFQDTGFIYTYLYGANDASNPDELEMHEFDIFTTAVIDNFGHSPNGLRVTPGFTFHFLDGPSQVGKISLPPQLYSAYLDGLWRPQLTPQFHADINLRVGVYSDFDEVNSDSLRYTGRTLGVVQLTPTLAMKAGIEYLDRNQVKLLPAGGFLWEPDENTRFDIYFPRPKLARYWMTNGNSTIWWHIGAEYGGGAWTFSRETAPDFDTAERIDINDVRVFTGIEWDRLNRAAGLLEIGYVFLRDVYVRNHRSEDIDLDDTFMVRAGLKW